MIDKEKYIRRCIQLAQNGIREAAPNPMVGAVIIHDNRIIGEGYHIRCGESHAEVNAIKSVKNKELLKDSTIYVSLEPCSHTGKTPPCADLIIASQIPHVVIGCQDPFSKVAGNGIKRLREHGIKVEVGILEKECLELIHRFCVFHNQKRPYIILKWAESADGFIDKKRTGGYPTILSSPLSGLITHKRRSEVSSILVGTNTARLDNPSLTTRGWYGKSPLRLVLDRENSLSPKLHLFDQSIPTIVFTRTPKECKNNLEYKPLDFNKSIPKQICDTLYTKGIQSILIEGGAQLHQSFIDSNLWDEIHIEKTSKILTEGIKSAQLPAELNTTKELHFNSTYLLYKNNKS